jgi:hypothetical protein
MKEKFGLFCILTVVLFFVGSTSFAGWVSPTGHQDPGNKWIDEVYAYDGNTGSYATDQSRATTGQWLVLEITPSIYCTGLKFVTDSNGGGWNAIDSVDVEVYKDGAWVNVYGELPLATPTENVVSFEGGIVTQARYRFKLAQTGFSVWLYEFHFFEAPPVISPPSTSTKMATSVETTAAVLHGEVLDDGGEPCQFRFAYGPDISYASSTTWSGSMVTGDTFGTLISGLQNGVTYHYRAEIQNASGVATGSDMTFTTEPPETGWLSFTTYDDGGGEWINVEKAQDDEITTTATHFRINGDPAWSPFLTMSRPEMFCDRVRLYATRNSVIDQVDVDISEDGVTWVDVYTGDFTNQTFVEYTFTPQVVAYARVRFHVNATNTLMNFELFEFDFHSAFSAYIEGDCNGTTDVVLAVDGYIFHYTGGASPYVFSGVPMGQGDNVVVYYDSQTPGSRGAVVTVASGTNILDLDLKPDTVIFRNEGGVPPTLYNSDIAAAHTGEATIPYSVSGNHVTIDPGIKLEIAEGHYYNTQANTLTVQDDLIIGGSFRSNGGTLAVAGATTLQVTGLAILNNLTVSGALDLDTYDPSFSTSGNVTVTGTVTPGSGNWRINGNGDRTLDAGDENLGNVQVNGNAQKVTMLSDAQFGTLTIDSDDELDLAGSAITAVTLTNTGQLTLQGGEPFTVTNFNTSAGKVLYNGAGSYGSLPAGASYSELEFDGTGVWNPAVDTDVSSSLTVTSGTLDLSPADPDINLTGSSVIVTGTLVPGAGTWSFTGSGGPSILDASGAAFESIVIDGTAKAVELGSDLAVNNLTIGGDDSLDLAGYNLTVGALANDGALILQGSETVVATTFDTDSGTVEYDGAGAYPTLAAGNAYYNLSFSGSGTWVPSATAIEVNKDLSVYGGILDLSVADPDVFLSGSNVTVTTPSMLNAGTGVWTFNGGGASVLDASGVAFNSIVIDGTAKTVSLGGSLQSATVTVGIDDTLDLSGDALTVGTLTNNGKVRLEGDEAVAVGTLNNSAMIEYYGSGTYSSLLLGNNYYDLMLSGSGAWTLGNPLNVIGDLEIANGTLNAAGNRISLAGDWINSGTYQAGGNEVELIGTLQSISGSSTFGELTKVVSATDTLTFEAGSTQVITGDLNLSGAAGNNLLLRSSSPGTPWNIDPQGFRNITEVDVQDSYNVNATNIDVAADDTVIDSGNNFGWDFYLGIREWGLY